MAGTAEATQDEGGASSARGTSSAAESNAAAARRNLWDALDTTRCGHPEIVQKFLAAVPAGARIVDVGCWNGAICALAAAAVGGGRDAAGAPWRSYVGVDVVPEALAEFARRNAGRPRTEALAGDARELPLAAGAADAVLCLFVLQDLPRRRDSVAALRELARVAAAGAPLLLGLTVHESREEETSYVVRKLRAEGIPEKLTYHWRRDDVLDAVRGCGLTIERIDAFGPNERGFVELYLHLRNASAGDPHGG
jgi:SAM-dependent methyltransferase